MSKAVNYPGADRKSRYYYPRVSGASQPRIDKLVWHSTETSPEWDCPSYAGGTAAPTLTVNPWPGREKVWQHFPANMSAKALVDPTSTAVRENRDNVAQVEVIGYSQRSTNPKYWLPTLPESGLAYLAKVAAWYAAEWGTPLVMTPLRWTWDAASNPSDPRYSGPGFDAFSGHLGHRHVSGNQHWDPSLNVSRIVALAKSTTPVAVTGTQPTPTGDLTMTQIDDLMARLDKIEAIATETQQRLGAWSGTQPLGPRIDKVQATITALSAAIIGLSQGTVTQEMLDEAVSKGLDRLVKKAAQ